MSATPSSAQEHASDLLMVGFEAPSLDGETRSFLNKIKPFGTILFARNMPERAGLLELTADLAALDQAGPIAIDHEGGRVDRLPDGFTHFSAALDLTKSGDPQSVRAVGVAHARELRAAGFQINFAPVLDVHTNPDNPIIGDRAFGTTPEEVVHFALPYMQGLVEGGIVGCGKHFPGHGDTSCDSHLELPVLGAESHGADRLRRLEMRPFARAISQGVPMIMTAHIRCETFDREHPATMSHDLLEGCLRRELGFKGVIVSDDLEMKAVADDPGVGEAGVQAVLAGCDLLLVCRRPERVTEAWEALVSAIESGRISASRLAAALDRRAKLRRRIAKIMREEVPVSWIGHSDHRRLAEELTPAAQ